MSASESIIVLEIPKKNDCCIFCGIETPYTVETPIEMRKGYVEGAGQLCKNCYSKNTEEE